MHDLVFGVRCCISYGLEFWVAMDSVFMGLPFVYDACTCVFYEAKS